MPRLRSAQLIALAATAVVLAPAAARADTKGGYYVSLGDSLASGVQPDAAGNDRPTSQGYVDVVGAALARGAPGWRTIKLGGGGTSTALISGRAANQAYGAGSQLRQAEAFLRAHGAQTRLVTVDIGDNDIEQCIATSGIDDGCVNRGMAAVARNLPTIARRLRAAANSNTVIVGIADYDQFWALWLRGARGRKLARESARIVIRLNQTMDRAWRQAGILVADAGPRFHTGDQRLVRAGGRMVPRAVERICYLTWACAAPPVGFDDHANGRGYRVIAAAVLDAIRSSHIV